MAERYVLLTGAKNNAGDFLIRLRGTQLLSRLRPDRELVVLNGWEELNDEQLECINDSRALILLGGPAVQQRMYGGVYALCDDLDRITAPVLTMGVGWKSASGSWADTRRYPLSTATLRLLEKVQDAGFASSVRDYHTLNLLQNYGFDNFMMTGCPALYPAEHVGQALVQPEEVRKVSFSLGVSFVHDALMERQMKTLVERLAERFGAGNVTVVFHHALTQDGLKVYGSGLQRFAYAHQRFADWLDTLGVAKADISGGVDAMLAHYSDTDLHVGYRVHAHILRLSLCRPSILIAEDGRGRALQHFLGGPIYCAGNTGGGKVGSVLNRLRLQGRLSTASSAAIEALPGELLNILDNEIRTDFPRCRQSVAVRNSAYQDMEHFVRALP